MRKYLSNTIINQSFINNLVYKHDEEIKELKEFFEILQEKTKTNTISLKAKFITHALY